MNKTRYKKLLQKIFKNFFYLLFKLKHGKIKFDKIIQKNLFEEENVIIEKDNHRYSYSVYSCSNSRLYTDRIQDTAIVKNNYLLDEPSFQLRNNIFDKNIEKNIVLKIGTPNIIKKVDGSVLSLLTGGGGNDNYFHWLFDVLPRIGIVEKIINLENIDYYLCPNLNNWQIKTLQLIGINKKRCFSSVDYRHIQAKKIITTNHPWSKSNDVIHDIENMPNWISTWLQQKFIMHKSNRNFPKKFYIDRSDSTSNLKNYRFITNEHELIKYLKSQGFEIIKLSKLLFNDQIKLFNDAETIIGLHGAGLSNLIWCKKNTKIIELRSKLTNKMYENLALQNRMDFHKIVSNPIDKVIANHYGSIKVDIDEIQKII